MLGSLALWHSNTGLRESERGTSRIQGVDTSSGLADKGSGRSDTSARRQGWSGHVGCCSGVGRDSILLYSCIIPGEVHFRPPPVSTSACPRGGGTCSPARGALDPGRFGRNPGRSDWKAGIVEPSSAAWCAMPRRADDVRGGTACCSEVICPLAFCEAPNRSLAPADGLLHEPLNPHRRVVSGGRQANPVSQCPGHREGKLTLSTREPPSCVARAKRLSCSWKTKTSQASNKNAICTWIQVEQAKRVRPSSVRRHG